MTDQGAPDAELLRDVATSAVAFEIFYRRHVDRITRFLAGRCRTPEDVADAVSATFLAVLVSSATFNAEYGSPTSWLYAIARNEARRQVRSIGRREALRLKLRGSALLTASDTDRLADIIDAEQAVVQLDEALLEAPYGERQLLGHIVRDGASVAEASRAIGISPAAGRKRLDRLRRRVLRTTNGALALEIEPITSLEDK